MLFEIIREQIFLVVIQPIHKREQMCFVVQHQLRGDDRSIGRLADDQCRGIVECLDDDDGGQYCIEPNVWIDETYCDQCLLQAR